MSDFVHLHLHTEYSLLDSTIKLGGLFNKLRSIGMNACSITDSGNMFGAVGFYLEARKQGVKPIIGSEMFIAPGSMFDKKMKGKPPQPHHLVLIAYNNTGYKNLMKLSSFSHLEGYYYGPRIDKELLANHSEGLLCLTGCLNGEIPRLIMRGTKKDLYHAVEEYLSIFGERMYLELQDNGYKKQQGINGRLIELSKHFGIPLVATNNCHYLEKSEKRAYEILVAIRQDKRLDKINLDRLITNDLYLKSAREMEKAFSNYPEALSNTLRLAEMCNVAIEVADESGYHFPDFHVPAGIDLNDYFEDVSKQGFDKRIPEVRGAYDSFSEELYDRYRERFAYELGVIKKTGFSVYFLIVADFINYAKTHDVPVGPGRSSAAGSLIAYCLGITDIDPIKHDLMFERFLNPERISMPDIDVDFCKNGRDDVIRYVTEKYGKDNVAHITTFGTMQSKAAVRDVGRALGIPYTKVDKIAKLVTSTERGIEKAINEEPRVRKLFQTDEHMKELLDNACILEGIVCHASTHAAGIVIADSYLTEYAPLYKNRHDETVTQYDMKMIEKIGLIKIDFLGLETLMLINTVVKSLREEEIDLVISRIPLDDKKAYDLLSAGDTLGVFQLESKGMRDILIKLKPFRFTDITALIALYRPGPMKNGMVDEFIKRKNNPSLVKYETPKLAEILQDTYGVIIYQEQIMKIASFLAGLSRKDADTLRMVVVRKIPEQLERYKKKFVDGAIANSVPGKVAENIYDTIERFGDYGFNKSHSTAYGLITYQTAYLKANYFKHYMAALLTNESHDADKMKKLMGECKKHDVRILPLDINKSEYHFAVEGDCIRYGFCGVNRVNPEVVNRILDTRKKLGEFQSWEQLQNIIDLKLNILKNLKKAALFGKHAIQYMNGL